MTMMPDLQELIVEHFKEIIDEFKFELKSPRYDEIQLINTGCILRFIYDAGYVICDFINPEEKRILESVVRKDGMPSGFPIYPIYSVWKFLTTL